LTNDVAAIRQAITSGLLGSLQQVILLVGAAGLLFVAEWRLAAVALATVPPIVIASAVFGRRLQRLTVETQAEHGSATTMLEETIAGARTVRAFGREEYEIGRYDRGVRRTFDAAMRWARRRAGFVPFISLCALLGVIGVLVLGAWQVGQGTLTPGALVSAILYITLMATAVGGLTGVYAQLREASGAAERLFELLDTTSEIVDTPTARPLPASVRGAARFDRLTFRYGNRPEARAVLRDLSLAIAPGERVAIVGPSGAGKSTLVNLLLRFYDPVDGTVTLDSHDLREVTLGSLRDALGVVPQEPVLFGGTVAENIAYGRQEATREEIAAAARQANAHDFIRELPEGYDTVVGERGARLSGGQRQRIAIARAILKDPRVLILDEATSSLDNTSEAIVREAL
jgi:subfamily B ATP-binding cassette protein MsbA